MLRLPSTSALILATLLAACAGGDGATSNTPAASGPAAAADIGDVLAEVNGQKVGSKEFEEAASRKQPALSLIHI